MMRYLITSALPYIQGIPHLGNFIGSLFPADVQARFLRLRGEEVIYICGSDMHGSPLEVQAYKLGRDVRELAYENHERVKKAVEAMEVSTDFWGWTDSEENKETTYEIFWDLWRNGYIKEEEIIMPYCNDCGHWLADRWIEGTCPYCGGLARGDQCDDCGAILDPTEIINPRCKYCGSTNITFRRTKQLVLDLPALADDLKKFYEERKHLWPENARKTTEHYLYKEGLKPRSISRFLNFGFPIPLKGYEDQVFYVWFDAPIGYIGITKQWAKHIGDPDAWKKWWKDKDTVIVHYIGKDNIFFHAIFWPAMLIGTRKDWTLPKIIASSEFLKARGVKFSKSRGVGLNIENALELLPPDYWRYVLAALFPARKDTEFSWDALKEKVNKELVETIANFVHRTLTLAFRYFGESIETPELDDEEKEKLEELDKLVDEAEKHYWSWLGFQEVVKTALRIASKGNAWLNHREPWKEYKDDPEKARRTLYVALHYVKALAVVLAPITPAYSSNVLSWLGEEKYTWNTAKERGIKRISKPEIIFRKIRDEQLEEWKKRFASKMDKTPTIKLEDFERIRLMTGTVRHVQEISGDDERWLLIIEGPDGNTYRAAPKIRKHYKPEELQGKNVLFFPLDEKEVVGGVEINAWVPLANDSVIVSRIIGTVC